MIQRTNILGVGVSAITMQLATAAIEGWIAQRERQYVCVTNVHVVMECQRDPALRRVLNQAGMVTPDGMPLVWVSRMYGQKQVRRVYGPDLLLEMCAISAQKGYRSYFYGGAEGVPDLLASKMTARFPGLQIVGFESPPFRKLTPEEDQAAVDRINRARPDLLWVGLGAPKQEHWLAAHLGRVEAPVMLGVGAAFDFHAGNKKQAPHWLQNAGLEWAFRFASEPRRLWKRYLLYNPWFVGLVLLQSLGLKRYPLGDESEQV